MIKARHEEWSTANRESFRPSNAEAALTKRTEALHALVVATQTLSAQQDLDELLEHLLNIARGITSARYAALAISHNNQQTPGQFFSTGTDDAAADAIRILPLEAGARKSLGQEHGTLSLNHLAKYWASLGLPANHRPMTVIPRGHDPVP